MAFVLIVGLVAAVATLVWLAVNQSRTIENYEKELLRKPKKGKK